MKCGWSKQYTCQNKRQQCKGTKKKEKGERQKWVDEREAHDEREGHDETISVTIRRLELPKCRPVVTSSEVVQLV